MPIVMSKDEWARITKWTDKDKEDPETKRRREYVKYLDETSQKMTRSWPNSLENVNKRNEELRLARIATAEQANSKFYKRYVKKRKEEQERLMFSARDTMFKNKDAPKLLLSSVIETCVQKEREEQIKFMNELREKADQQKRESDKEICERAKAWHELMALKAHKRFLVNKQHQKEILDQAHEISERERNEYETELNMQKLDNIQAQQQMDAIKEFEENFKKAEKARIWADMKQARKESDARKAELAALDKLDDKLLEILTRSNAEINRRRKQTELDIKSEKQRLLAAISAKLESGDAARDAKEQACLNKAQREKDAADEERRQANERKLQQVKAERLASRAKFLKDEEQRIHEVNTMLQWEMMNRFKNQELYDAYQENLREEKRRKIQEYRAEILRLWNEREDREKRERDETRYFYGELALRKLRDADNKVLTHANDLLQEAKANGRPTHPLNKAIDRYCKMYRLYPMPDLPKSMKEHFGRYAPWDGSAPDAGYARPPPPPETQSDDEEDAPPPAQPPAPPPGTNGLQDAGPSTSRPAKEKQEETVEDYRRAAKANGLQRKEAYMNNDMLPPIRVIPCKNESCRCELRQ